MAVEQVVVAETTLGPSFIQQAFIEYLLCARHHTKQEGLSYKQVPASVVPIGGLKS